jgi:cell division protein FtsB
MRWLIISLLIVLGLLQYRLWLGQGSLLELRLLRTQLQNTQQELEHLRTRNQALAAEVENLKTGTAAIEERARFELGMIRQGELFLQVIEQSDAQNPPLNQTEHLKN